MSKPYHIWIGERRMASLAKSYGFAAGAAWAQAGMIAEAPDRLKAELRYSARTWGQEARRLYKQISDAGLMTNPLD